MIINNGLIKFILDILDKESQYNEACKYIDLIIFTTIIVLVTFYTIKYLVLFLKLTIKFIFNSIGKMFNKMRNKKDRIICHRCNRHLNQCVCDDNKGLTSREIYRKYKHERKWDRKSKKIKMKRLKNKNK